MRSKPKDKIIPVRVTKEQRAELMKRAKKAGWKYYTAYAHHLLFGSK